MAPRIKEGSLNQYIEKLVNDMPEHLVEYCKDIQLNIHKEAQDIIEKYAESSESAKTSVDYLRVPSNTLYYNFMRKKKYHIDEIKKEFDQNHEYFLNDEACSPLTPFQDVSGAIKLGYIKKEDVEKRITDQFDDWYEKIKKQMADKSHKQDIKDWVGICHYPFIENYQKNAKKSFSRFLIIDLTDYILHHRRYNDSPILFAPDSVLEINMFAAGRANTSVRQQYDYDEIKNSPSGSMAGFIKDFDAQLALKEKLMLTVPGPEEQAVLFSLFSKGLMRYLESGGSSEISGTLADICKAIYPDKKKFSSKDYEHAKDVFENVRGGTIWTVDKGTSYPLFGKVKTEWTTKEGGTQFTLRLGHDLTNDMMLERYSVIMKDQILKLKSSTGLSRLMYAKLRKDRIENLLLNKSNMNNDNKTAYTLIQLGFIAKPISTYKKGKIKEYGEAFEDMKKLQMLIKDYRFEKLLSNEEAYVIEWLPLSEAEKKDLYIVIGDTEEDKAFLTEMNKAD